MEKQNKKLIKENGDKANIDTNNEKINKLKKKLSNNNFDIVKKNIDEKIKILEKENNIYMEKLEEIKNRRNSMLFQQEKDLGILENNKKLKLKKFIKDLNNKENSLIIEEKMKKLQEDSKKVQLKMDIDLKKAINKKNEQIIKLEKENEQKIQKYRDEMREKERETIKRRGEIAKNQILSLKRQSQFIKYLKLKSLILPELSPFLGNFFEPTNPCSSSDVIIISIGP